MIERVEMFLKYYLSPLFQIFLLLYCRYLCHLYVFLWIQPWQAWKSLFRIGWSQPIREPPDSGSQVLRLTVSNITPNSHKYL